jgi:hypothetical protein
MPLTVIFRPRAQAPLAKGKRPVAAPDPQWLLSAKKCRARAHRYWYQQCADEVARPSLCTLLMPSGVGIFGRVTMTWLQTTLWVGSVWLAFLVGFVLGAAWNGLFRRDPAGERHALKRGASVDA